jgi:hypothetical protein
MRVLTVLLSVVLSGCYLHGSTLQDAKRPSNAYKSLTVDRPFAEVKQALASHERACGQFGSLRLVDDDFIRYSTGPYDDPNMVWVVVELQPVGEITQLDAFAVVSTWRSFADRIIAAVQNPTVCT